MPQPIRLFETFAGYGGASFALKKAGITFECIGYSEIDKWAIKVFNQNFSNVKNFGDCTKINTQELPNFDLLTGGFPCQDVSIAGNRDLSKGRTNLYKLAGNGWEINLASKVLKKLFSQYS